MQRTVFHSLLIAASCIGSVHPFVYSSPEEPVMPLMLPPALSSGKATTINVAFTRTHGNEAFADESTVVPFLEHYGTGKISDLYNGIATPNAPAHGQRFFATDGASSLTNMTDADAAPYTAADAEYAFRDPHNNYQFDSYHMSLTHHLFSGFFARVHVHLIEQTIQQKMTATGPDATHDRVVQFLANSDAVLNEIGHPSLGYARRQMSIEHVGCYLGWTGSTKLISSAFEEISGVIQAGYNVEPSTFEEKIAPTILPYSRNDSFTGMLSCTMQMLPHIALQNSVAVTVHTTRKGDMAIVRDDLSSESFYNGPLLLGDGFVKKDPGTAWVVESSMLFNRLAGFYARLGYHFSHQEKTRLTLLDDTVLTGADWDPTPLSKLPFAQNERINSNPTLEKWNNHAFLISIGFTPKSTDHRIIPQFECGIYWPVMGYRSIAARPIYSGSGQLCVRWTF